MNTMQTQFKPGDEAYVGTQKVHVIKRHQGGYLVAKNSTKNRGDYKGAYLVHHMCVSREKGRTPHEIKKG
jgi:hypothetical protein